MERVRSRAAFPDDPRLPRLAKFRLFTKRQTLIGKFAAQYAMARKGSPMMGGPAR